ncbi:hypothetical protein [Tenacibaculum sp. IB213877]|uniref:hypothetical protein n=1 Tax=Tenacibaculum sp. IB213877 TaxID=3097351 RepID=UPI002A59DDCB|nr:hypothetical protein [Tenacibaculum sp. IB213877]MDY0780687.1 hypothetical protein [Tenacibaculum sp. IB213877]
MSKNLLVLIILCFFSTVVVSQNKQVCVEETQNSLDLNSIGKKCAAQENSKTFISKKQSSIMVSSSRDHQKRRIYNELRNIKDEKIIATEKVEPQTVSTIKGITLFKK